MKLEKNRRVRIQPPPGCDPDSIVLTFRVAPEHARMRLDRFVQNRIPRLSRTKAQEIVKNCAYRRDGTKRRPSEKVKVGETVLIVRPYFEEPETPRFFNVVFEDESILAVDKPAGLPMHPTATYHRNTLTYLLRETYGEPPPQIAHRLDRETSGLVICGKNKPSERALKIDFENRKVEKTYLAIVEGQMQVASGVINAPLSAAQSGLHVLMEVSTEGAASETYFEVVEAQKDVSLVHLFPRTGRQHQLRVHLASIGHPIVGDKLYGFEGADLFMEYIETGLTDSLLKKLGHDRQALHAFSLKVNHPTKKETLSLTAPFSSDLVMLWQRKTGQSLNDKWIL